MLTAFLVVVSLSGMAQQPPPPPMQGQVRDRGMRQAAQPTGTGVIRGRVVAADAGSPMRRAQVSLMAVLPPPTATGASGTAATVLPIASGNGMGQNAAGPRAMVRRTVTSDAQGAFEFRDLPAGSYRISASPGTYSAGYLPIAYGAKAPNGPGSADPGTPIDLADGQSFDKVTIALPRAAVIAGRVTDDNGDALARVQVYTIMYLPGSSRAVRTGGNAQTDDRGQFRMYGLTPGDYLVAAEARGNTFVPPNAPPQPEEDETGFLTTFYPGAPDESGAQRVSAKAGAETTGLEIRMLTGRLFHLTGMVVDSQGRPSTRGNGTLFKRATSGTMSTFGFPIDAQGRFQLRNIPPGDYRLTVREQPQPGMRSPDGTITNPGEFASMPISINADMDDVLVTTSPGVTITGTVVFENGAPEPTPGQKATPIRVTAAQGDPAGSIGAPMPPPALVAPDLTFTMKGMSGEFLLRASAPNNYLESVQLGGQDITDTPHEFKPGDRVTLVLTARASTLEGTVTDADGKPTNEAAVILFSDDKTAWRSNSIHTRRSGTDANGAFHIMGLLPGRYYLIALPRERMNGLTLGADPSVFETLSRDATTVALGENEQRQVDLKLSSGGGN